MWLWLFRPLRFLADAVRETTTPTQIGWGIALGMAVGIVPKDNLLAFGLGIVLFAANVNLPAGMLSALAFSVLGSFLDSTADRIGTFVLTNATLQPYWTTLYEQPLVPWTKFNNTIVMGQFLLAIALLYPVYLGGYKVAEKYVPKIEEKLKKYRLYHLLFGADLASTWRVG